VVGLLYVPFLNRGRIPIGSLGTYVQSFRFNGPVFAALDQLAPPQLLAGLVAPQRAKAKSLLTSDTRSDNILPTFRLLLGGMAHRATRLHAFSGSSLTLLIQGSLSQASDGQEVIQSPVLLSKK
jgi:hypothetical protein